MLSARARRALLLAAARRIPSRFDLERLGRVFGTDKVDRWHTHEGLTYCAVYERYLREWRRRRFTLLELGVYGGASLRMWQAYFPKADVVGLDIDPKAAARASEFDVVVGSQADPKALDTVLDREPPIRIVIDDASHLNELTIASFRQLFPRLPAGSLYIIEDLAPGSYGDREVPSGTLAEAMAKWPGMDLNTDVALTNDRDEFDDFLRSLVHDCDLGGDGTRQVAYVHVWPSLIIVGRA